MEDLIHDEARDVFATIANFATIITSEALATRAQWPFVSVPHFEVRGMELNSLSNSLMVGFSPLVQDDVREKWEVYANYMQKWIEEGLEYNVEMHKDSQWQVEHLELIYPTIWRTNQSQDGASEADQHEMNPNATRIPDQGPGPYLPIWQQSPAPHDPHAILYNLFNHQVFDRVYHGMRETLSPVLSEATDLEFFYGGSIEDDIQHPHSFLLQPVFQDFNETHRDSSHIMGVAIAILPWDHYYENILPPEAHGIVVVMRDTCGDQFSYQVNGAHAIFLGYGDFHDPAYDYLVEVSPFAPFERRNFSDTHEHCEYDLHIYPSSELEEDYRTNKPILYAFLVVSVFFVTAMVFTVYDIMVQRRQKKVALAAKKSKPGCSLVPCIHAQ
jgi:hypothetical protein